MSRDEWVDETKRAIRREIAAAGLFPTPLRECLVSLDEAQRSARQRKSDRYLDAAIPAEAMAALSEWTPSLAHTYPSRPKKRDYPDPPSDDDCYRAGMLYALDYLLYKYREILSTPWGPKKLREMLFPVFVKKELSNFRQNIFDAEQCYVDTNLELAANICSHMFTELAVETVYDAILSKTI
jgi:hypothetical protein